MKSYLFCSHGHVAIIRARSWRRVASIIEQRGMSRWTLLGIMEDDQQMKTFEAPINEKSPTLAA